MSLARAGVDDLTDVDVCTAASPDHFSHRRDGVTGRQAVVVVRTLVTTVDAATVAERVAEVRDRIAAAAARAGTRPGDDHAGRRDQDRRRRARAAGRRRRRGRRRREPRPGAAGQDRGVDGARWHFLGQLQRNKVRQLAPWVGCWQSVDRAELGAEIARRAPGAGCWSR